MNLCEYEKKHFATFWKAIEKALPGYQRASFRYFAVYEGSSFELVAARLMLQGIPTPVPSGHFHSPHVRAGAYREGELQLAPRQVLESLLSGSLTTPRCELLFLPESADRPYSIHASQHSESGARGTVRVRRLGITGARRSFSANNSDLDWELKAANPPFATLQELCDEFSVEFKPQDARSIEVIASNVVEVAECSFVSETRAHLAIHLANGLNREDASLRFRVLVKGKAVKRKSISGKELSWTDADALQLGKFDLEVPPGAAVDCAAVFGGEAQHAWQISDPDVVENPLRAVHEKFDSKLKVLDQLLHNSQGKGDRAREFEVSVSWLFSMLGFRVTHLGGTRQTKEAPDLIAVTPQGHFAVIECTTGLLKEDHKLPHLVERANMVAKSLAASGNGNLRVLPIIITNKTREEAKADIEQAGKLGTFVICRDEFGSLMEQSLPSPDADAFFQTAEEAVKHSNLKRLFAEPFGV